MVKETRLEATAESYYGRSILPTTYDLQMISYFSDLSLFPISKFELRPNDLRIIIIKPDIHIHIP